MALARWNPFNDQLDFADAVLSAFGAGATPNGATAVRGWTPRVDIHEDAESVRLEADLPGVDAKDVEISVDGDVLTLKGERKDEQVYDEKGYHRTERFFGRFERRFTLPRTVERDRINAAYKNGVLILTLPKREEVKPRRIEVAVQ